MILFLSVRMPAMCVNVHGGQKRALDPMDPELQEVVSYFLRVLRTEFGSAGRAARAPNHRVISPAPIVTFK